MNELQQDLNSHISDRTKVTDSFIVDNDEKANWALRKIAEHKEHISSANELAQKEIDKIENWFKQINEQRQNQIEHLQGMLAEYAEGKRKSDPKFKSMKLPNGRFGFRKRPDKWSYDDDKLIKSLKESGMTELIKVEEKANKRDLRRAFEAVNGNVINPETGEVIEGITVEEQGESFNVRVD